MAKYKPADEVLSMSNNISGKVVVITGASSGLGEVTARHLAALGARVVLAARRKDKRIRPANTPSWPRRQRRWCPPDLSGHHF